MTRGSGIEETEPRASAESLRELARRHDERIESVDLDIWLGAEPTFTDRHSTLAEWRTAALGADKETRAHRFVCRLARRRPGCAILRTLGRQYPGESTPRWSIGIWSRRDGVPVWRGPPDPSLILEDSARAPDAPADEDLVERLVLALSERLVATGFATRTDLLSPRGRLLLFAREPGELARDWSSEPSVSRPPLEACAIPLSGARDELATTGVRAVAIGVAPASASSGASGDEGEAENASRFVRVELPAFDEVAAAIGFLETLGDAANSVELDALIISGYPPPVDASVAWTTLTPDPGVLEINMAPSARVADFVEEQDALFGTAAELGLSPFQLLYNGEVVDSGGGQHMTFGGPTAEASPFLLSPRLLPRLVAYCNRHPSLSYWFAVRAVGSCGQQPRSDEVSRESFDGLRVALSRLERDPRVTPETLWMSLAPFMVDRFGNTHRCEINIEKLWNPYLPDRGKLGVVELRAFRMMQSLEQSVAVAVLLRSLVAWLSISDVPVELASWGESLHDRFALPFHLKRDLREVLEDLARGGFPLDELVAARILDDERSLIGEHILDGARLSVRQATEFWPVVGDLADAAQSFRMMDASTMRIELRLELPEHDGADDWTLMIDGMDVPLVRESGEDGRAVLLRGVRYKAFRPQLPVAPLVPVTDPLAFCLQRRGQREMHRICLHGWRPGSTAYDGLPTDFSDAAARRKERLVLERVPSVSASRRPPPAAMSEFAIDLRHLTLADV